jgi:predicted glutamine amidotransferase
MCSLAGVIDPDNILTPNIKRKLVRSLLIAGEVRGRDATGFAYVADNELRIFKAGKPARRVRFYFPDETRIIMGHNRAATCGSPRFNQNNHPFYGQSKNQKWALAHNGVLWGNDILRKQYSLPLTQIETDSYIAVQLLEYYGKLDFEALKFMAETVQGSFTFTLLDDENNLYFVKGDNPLELILFKEIGVFVYASTPEILNRALLKSKLSGIPYTKFPLNCGDILKIGPCGEIERSTFKMPSYDPWDYLSRWTLPTEPGPSLHEIIELGKIAGFNEDDLTELFYEGYSSADIEELFEDPKALREQLDYIEIDYEDGYDL